MNTATGKYMIIDTLYPSQTVPTDRPLMTQHAAIMWTTLHNRACGSPSRYAVRLAESPQGSAALSLGSL